MSIGDPLDGCFYHTLTLMVDSHSLIHPFKYKFWVLRRSVSVAKFLLHGASHLQARPVHMITSIVRECVCGGGGGGGEW